MTDDSIVRFSVPGINQSSSPASGAAANKQKAKGLGRGLGALLGETRREEPLTASAGGVPGASSRAGGLAVLSISDIQPDPHQPRRIFEEAALEELAASIAQRGVIPTDHRASAGQWPLPTRRR